MKIYFFSSLFSLGIFVNAQNPITPFERNHQHSATYKECIQYFKSLDQSHHQIHIIDAGPSDLSYPINLVIIDKDGLINPRKIRAQHRTIIFINNGIHPGEPEGIDASMQIARDMVLKPKMKTLLDSISLVIVPVYNIGGALKRNNTSRTNQNGPEYYGFRGNNNYLDLNRDFVKQDSRNARTFASAFQEWNPDIFIDTHTTDGADYPYEISLLTGMREKLGETLSGYIYEKMLPEIYTLMKKSGTELISYVEFDQKIEDGMYAFYDRPRFSSGYAAMYHTLPFVIETHMLKPFENRVQSTYLLLKTFIQYSAFHKKDIISIRKKSMIEFLQMKNYPLRWKINSNLKEMIPFNTYSTSMKYYPFLQDSMLVYDRTNIIPKEIPYYEHYTAINTVSIPSYYVIPQSYFQVIDNLKRNGVQLTSLTKDSVIHSRYYKIIDYKSPNIPYENHFIHSQIEIQEIEMDFPYYKGDLIVSVQQKAKEYILQTLEPQGDDSFFAWNFFDGILMRKEYYSNYAFAPIAESMLRDAPELQKMLLQKTLRDSSINHNIEQKLNYIYKNSKFSEPYLQIYPVARIF